MTQTYKAGDRVEVFGYGYGWDGPATVDDWCAATDELIAVTPDGKKVSGAFNVKYIRPLGPQVGDLMFAPAGITTTYGGEVYFDGPQRVIVEAEPDEDGDVYVVTADRSHWQFVDPAQLVPVDTSNDDRIFVLDKKGLKALPVGAKLVDVDYLREGVGDIWELEEDGFYYGSNFGQDGAKAKHVEEWAPFELLNPEVLDLVEYDIEIVPAAGTRIKATYCAGFVNYPPFYGTVAEEQDQAGRVRFLVDEGEWPGGHTLYADEWEVTTLGGYALTDEIEGPVFVLDDEGLDALPDGSLVQIVGRELGAYDLRFRTDRGWVKGEYENGLDLTASMVRIHGAEVLYIAD